MLAPTQVDLVQAHSKSVQKKVEAFLEDLREVSVVSTKAVIAYINRSTEQDGGILKNSPQNALALRSLDREYVSALSLAGYHEVVSKFVSTFSDEVDAFREMYQEMREETPSIPAFTLTPDDGEVLATRASLSLAALEANMVEVVGALRRASVLVIGEVPIDFVADYVSDVIGRTSKVGPLAKDLLFGFFRNVSTLAYSNVEALGATPLYTYTGTNIEGTREFCSSLASVSLTKQQIEQLNNGQIPNVFMNAGGYGCSHFWRISGVEQ